MARFTLVIRPDGRAILTCAERIPPAQQPILIAALREWQGCWPPAVAIIDDCDVVQVLDVELDLEAAVPA